MRRGLAALVSAVLVTAPAMAETACPAPGAMQPASGRLPFVQTRHLSNIAEPIGSSGYVDISDAEVVWTVLDPIEVRTVISDAGILQAVEDGPLEPVSSAGVANPMVSESGLIDLLKGNFAAVSTYYDVEEVPASGSAGWRVRLHPKNAGVAEYLTGINLTGCRSIETVEIVQSNGDVMNIGFGTE